MVHCKAKNRLKKHVYQVTTNKTEILESGNSH